MKRLKSENAPPPDIEVAIKELKVRKKALENKVCNLPTVHFTAILPNCFQCHCCD